MIGRGTARGIVLQSFDYSTVKNGVVAACRFWDIAQGVYGGGEVINVEATLGLDDTVFNNAFIWSHAYNCSGAGVILYGAGIHNNLFSNLTLHVMSGSIAMSGFVQETDPEGDFTAIYNNNFENIEMGANLYINGHCYGNNFNQIVQLQNPIRMGGNNPAVLGYYGYTPTVADVAARNYQAYLPFYDVSTYDPDVGEGANIYHSLYLSTPNGLTQVFCFPTIQGSL